MKNSQEFVQNRRDSIVKYINSQDSLVSCEQLSEKFSASIITIRRDLQQLAAQNLIQKVHGGARRLYPETPAPSAPAAKDREPVSAAGDLPDLEYLRRKLAQKAAEQLQDQDIVFINSSLTASYVIEYLDGKHVTVVTNNLAVGSRRRPPYVTLIFTGGQAIEGTNSMTGVYAIDLLNKITADKCILGVRGISDTVGITSSILEQTFVNQQMIQQTKGDVIVVADNRKIGNSDRFFSADIQKIDVLITDLHADPAALAHLREKGIHVFTV